MMSIARLAQGREEPQGAPDSGEGRTLLVPQVALESLEEKTAESVEKGLLKLYAKF